jgi:hypothetical protein
MKNKLILILLALQSAGLPGTASEPGSNPVTIQENVLRDPTAPDPRLEQIIGGRRGPALGSAKLPAIRVLAKLLVKSKPGVAVFGVEKEALTLAEGGTAAVPGDLNGTTLTVEKITASVVRVRFNPGGQVLSLH